MPSYLLLSGETIKFPAPPPNVAAFLARVEKAAIDPAVDVNKMIELVYGDENPILDRDFIPGRPMVTRKVLDNPVYSVLSNLIGVKRVQLGLLDMAAVEAANSISVQEAAEQLGITPAAIRAAIKAHNLAGHFRNGQWYTRPESVAAYRVSNRGPKKSSTDATVLACVGSEPGRSMALNVEGGELIREGKTGNRTTGHLSPGWKHAVVKTTVEGTVRGFVIEPANSQETIQVGALFVRGQFRIVKKANSLKAVKEIWATGAHAHA